MLEYSGLLVALMAGLGQVVLGLGYICGNAVTVRHCSAHRTLTVLRLQCYSETSDSFALSEQAPASSCLLSYLVVVKARDTI